MSKCRKIALQPDAAERLLKSRSRRLTKPRMAVLKLLAEQHHPVSAAEIHSGIKDAHCDLATVYRSIRLLEKDGVAQRYDFGDGIGRYELARKEGALHHHHHLVCTRCAGVVEIEECSLQKMQQTIALRNGFKSVSHRLEFFGVCPACQ